MMELTDLRRSSVLFTYTDKCTYNLSPEYQRLGDIWTKDKKQLLVDSVINGYDIPKLYFHKLSGAESKEYRYSIIDGKQRLQALWGFIDGEFALSDDFEYLANSSVSAGGMGYVELARDYPQLKMQFDTYQLSIVAVETDDMDLIEDMFSRLNEAVPLSAPEKRNAFGGTMTKGIRELATHNFFERVLPFTNRRYKHFDLAGKYLLIEFRNKISDTKKVYLDRFVQVWKSEKRRRPEKLLKNASIILDKMANTFTDGDVLVRSVGDAVLYYYVFKLALEEGWLPKVSRKKFIQFNKMRIKNREIAERDIGDADYDLLEYDRYVQSPNDAYATELRLRILLKKAFNRSLNADELKTV